MQVLGLTEGYHGDTLGAMDAVAPSPFNGRLQTPWYTGRGLFLEPPTVALQQGTWRVSLPADMVAATAEAAALAAQVVPGARQKPFATEFGSREAVFALQQRMHSSSEAAAAATGADAEAAGEAAATASLYPFYLRYIQQQLDDYEAAQQQLEAGSNASVAATSGQGQQQPRRRVLGACIVEPVLQGAGGMRLIDPLYQRALVEVCRRVVHHCWGRWACLDILRGSAKVWLLQPATAQPACMISLRGCGSENSAAQQFFQLFPPCPPQSLYTHRERRIPVIFDEVFTGLWRLGAPSGAALLGTSPDIACYAKLLTGGTVPLSATLARESVFRAFEGERRAAWLGNGAGWRLGVPAA